MSDLEHGWVSDGSTGQDDPYFCVCGECLGYLDPTHEDDDGHPLCEACWEKFVEDAEGEFTDE